MSCHDFLLVVGVVEMSTGGYEARELEGQGAPLVSWRGLWGYTYPLLLLRLFQTYPLRAAVKPGASGQRELALCSGSRERSAMVAGGYM